MKKIVAVLFVFMFVTSVCGEYVNSDNGLRVRKEPNLDADVICVLPFATEILCEKSGDWLYSKEYDGYVLKDFVQPTNPLDDFDALGDWHITAYTWTGLQCANGNYPEADYTIACNSLDFGTVVWIEGVGFRTVEDRGPASMGKEWCDLYMDTYDECVQWGSQTRKVYVVDYGS